MKRKMYPDNMIVGDLGTYGMCEEIEQTHPNESDLQYAIDHTDNMDEEELPLVKKRRKR